MIYRINWTPQSLRDLKRLDKTTTRRIVDGVNRLATENYGDVKKLTGLQNEYRLRIGDWRVRFIFEREIHVLSVLRVLPREDAYRDV